MNHVEYLSYEGLRAMNSRVVATTSRIALQSCRPGRFQISLPTTSALSGGGSSGMRIPGP